MRICIAGGPRTGKTTLSVTRAMELGVQARHTDDLVGRFDWSEASAEVARWFDEPGPWVIEGVAMALALRKWLVAHPDGKPCDHVYLLTSPFEPWTKPQETMAKGCATVWAGIEGLLVARGVVVIRRGTS